MRCAARVGVVSLSGSRGCVVSTCRARVCGDRGVVGVARQGGAYGSALTVVATGRRRGVCCLRSVLLLSSSLVTCGRVWHRRHRGNVDAVADRSPNPVACPRSPATSQPHPAYRAMSTPRSRHAARRDAPGDPTPHRHTPHQRVVGVQRQRHHRNPPVRDTLPPAATSAPSRHPPGCRSTPRLLLAPVAPGAPSHSTATHRRPQDPSTHPPPPHTTGRRRTAPRPSATR